MILKKIANNCLSLLLLLLGIAGMLLLSSNQQFQSTEGMKVLQPKNPTCLISSHDPSTFLQDGTSSKVFSSAVFSKYFTILLYLVAFCQLFWMCP